MALRDRQPRHAGCRLHLLHVREPGRRPQGRRAHHSLDPRAASTYSAPAASRVRDPCGRLEWRHGAAEVEPWCRSRATGFPHGAGGCEVCTRLLHQLLPALNPLPSPLDLELFRIFSFADLFEGFRSIFVSFVHGVFPSDPDPCYLFCEICAGSAFLIQVGFLLKFQAYV